ncbi:MAG TPA: DNA repair protein RecN [Bryobacteraceae bacterium]|nr:DNA repair protein RecN [Bryobacteraceae bacterium]
MLLELVVENYAVVDRLRIRFHAGLNLLTGETGSGKSIVVDALGLLFGGRASADMIRSGQDRARVSGIFTAPDLSGVDLAVEEGELLIEREILAGGKSRAFIGSRPAAAALLKELAPLLGDIHGQHEQQLLFSPEAQLRMLDQFAGSRDSVHELFANWTAVKKQLEELERGGQEKLRLLDLWNFQKREIESTAPKPGEDEALEQERRVLMSLERLQESAGAAFAALYDSPDSALTMVRAATKRLDDLARIDTSVAAIRETLEPAAIAIQEASYSLRDYLDKLEPNPMRLEQIEERLAALDKLKRKYGASLEEVIAFLEEVRLQIGAVENTGERMEALRKRQSELAVAFETAAARLTAARRKAAQELERQVVGELASLAMERSVFRIELTPAPWSQTGADAARFLVSANAGETPKPLEKVASGGELSRIALALKTCLAASGAGRTLVFDEVDAGVGGRAAEGIGRRLKQLAAADQVLCVTHLAQIAGFADHHYLVEKREAGGRTVATVEELDRAGRVREIGRMLSGEKLTSEALQQAERLIETGLAAVKR